MGFLGKLSPVKTALVTLALRLFLTSLCLPNVLRFPVDLRTKRAKRAGWRFSSLVALEPVLGPLREAVLGRARPGIPDLGASFLSLGLPAVLGRDDEAFLRPALL